MARSMGLDVGNRRIGVAISDALKLIARPLQVIDRKQQDALEIIRALISTQMVDEVIVGYPYHADGRVGKQAQLVEQFINALRKSVSVPVHLYDERDSTGEAREIISANKSRNQPQHDDAIAAAVILQRYLFGKHPDSGDQDIEDAPETTSFDDSK